MILAGDIGGTNTRLALCRVEGERFQLIFEKWFTSRAYSSLREIVRTFVSAYSLPVSHACFGVAGPIKDGRCETTNLAWVVDAQTLAPLLGLKTVSLINDLEATAYGVMVLEAKDFAVLNPGASDAVGNAAIIAAGTGLGEAG